MRDTVIHARGLKKVYRLYAGPGYRFLDLFGMLGRRAGAYTEHAALDGVDLDISRGEKVAFIGRNGAGKSTLLKLITKVIDPTSGTLDVKGKAHALLQIGSGFHPDFTGRENVYAYLAQLGVTGAEAERKYLEIVDFAELEEYIGQPVKTYSSGMAVRLMFSTSTAIAPDLLVLDEVLGVGDAYFAQKSYDRIRQLCDRDGGTLLLVTHDVYSAVKICERLIWIDRGRILMDDAGPTVVKAYEDSIRQQEEVRLRLRQQQRLEGATTPRGGRPAHAIIEVQSAENRPLAAAVYFSRIELVTGATRLRLPFDAAAFDESQASHLQRDGTAWGDAERREGRLARALLNYGSPFHKVAGVVPLVDLLAEGTRIEIDYASDEAFRVTVKAFVGDRSIDFGILEGQAGGWQTWSADGIQGGSESVVNASGIYGTGAISVARIESLDPADNETHFFEHGGPFALRLNYRINRPSLSERAQVLVAFLRDGVQDVCRVITRDLLFEAARGLSGEVRLTIPKLWLGPGTYSVTVMVAREGYYDETQARYFSLNPGVYACHSRVLEIVVTGGGPVASGTVMVGDGKWSLRT